METHGKSWKYFQNLSDIYSCFVRDVQSSSVLLSTTCAIVCHSLSSFLLRAGNVVLFHTPTKKITVELGLVISVFKGVKAPKLHPGDVPISSCSAFRVLQLDLEDETQPTPKVWHCRDRSMLFVVRLEALISVLDVESCALAVHLHLFLHFSWFLRTVRKMQ